MIVRTCNHCTGIASGSEVTMNQINFIIYPVYVVLIVCSELVRRRPVRELVRRRPVMELVCRRPVTVLVHAAKIHSPKVTRFSSLVYT